MPLEIHIWLLGHGVSAQLSSAERLTPKHWDRLLEYAALAKEAAFETEELLALRAKEKAE